MSRPAIAAAGAYAPRLRITSDTIAEVWDRHRAGGISALAVPDADEDALTMAWEAARRALNAAGADARDVVFLAFATSTPPLDEEDLSVRLGSTLGVPSTASRHYFTGSTRASTSALEVALAEGPWEDGIGLVVAADAPIGEPDDALGQGAGAGAAAFILADDGGAFVEATGAGATVTPGERFRRRGSNTIEGLDITSYDRDAYQTAIEQAVEDMGQVVDDVDAVAMYAPDGKRPYRLASTLGVESEVITRGTTVHDLGDTGAASVPLGMVAAFESEVTTLLAIGYGSGAAADAFYLSVGDVPVETSLETAHEIDYGTYLRRRGWLTSGEPEGGGAYVSLPTWRRSIEQRHRLIAGRCRACGELVFPPEGACPDCTALDGYEKVRLPGTGTVEATSTIAAGGAPPEFDRQQSRAGAFPIAIVAFDGPDDDQVSIPTQVVDTDTAPDVGDPAEAVIRRIYTQEGVPRYGVKVRQVPTK